MSRLGPYGGGVVDGGVVFGRVVVGGMPAGGVAAALLEDGLVIFRDESKTKPNVDI